MERNGPGTCPRRSVIAQARVEALSNAIGLGLSFCALIMCLMLWSPAAAAPATTNKKIKSFPPDTCYVADFPQGPDGIKRIMLDLSDRRLTVEYWGLPTIAFGDEGMWCSVGARRAWCTVDCDGGNSTFVLRPDGKVIASIGTRFISNMSSLLQHKFDADGTSIRGAFTLSPEPKSYCEDRNPLMQSRRLANLQLSPGDMAPLVERLEQNLSELGFFAERPDYYFTRDTADALTAFQRSVGLPVTGIADTETFTRLGLLAVLGGGC